MDKKADFLKNHADPVTCFDQLREQPCPVQVNNQHWPLMRHQDVVTALLDPDTFSNQVSSHLHIPNGMDPPKHGPYRATLDPFFTAERMAEFQPIATAIARNVLSTLPRASNVDVMKCWATPYAVQILAAFMGWPRRYQRPLVDWIKAQQRATHDQDRRALQRLANTFDSTIREIIGLRKNSGHYQDVTAELCQLKVNGRPLDDEEIISIIRNWTVGELGTIAAAMGSLVVFLAKHPNLQTMLRSRTDLIDYSVDEILRIDAPLLSQRRRTTCPVHIGGDDLDQDTEVTILWSAANRDPRVFQQPTQFRFDREPELSLLYGKGIHRCPGEPFARLVMNTFVQEMLSMYPAIDLAVTKPLRAKFPSGGYEKAYIHNPSLKKRRR
ncbi:MAG: cytochrome P450 [Aliidiomarina sp.]|uniref:cytochrome P450 n=1 Tax=Aliidiomarina sp. TaxID=1872439 RepID=UPI0025C52E3A|nr:cytochrome P450 [Aliidiomarina sp.]MCH8501723.1 cytochrome P450 [Aliidiomarina sp.]